jgi:multimeric flavodoxin WrbA
MCPVRSRQPMEQRAPLAVMPFMAARQKTFALKVFGLNCSLKSSKSRERSSTDALMQQLFGELGKQGATGKIVRAADYNIKPGVKSHEGKGDDWPGLRRQLLAADILVIGAPIWLGQPSSIAKRVMERMDAFLDEKDERGRMPSYGKVVIAAIVGNEDGAHHTAAEILSGLIEVGFTVPSGGATYWVGEAMGSKEYKEFKRPPKVVAKWTQMLASNTAHLARLLKVQKYPGIKGGR